jgi:Protein of unknown function (DUF3180)
VTATGVRTLVGWAAAGLVIGWLVARLIYVGRGEVIGVPLSAAVVLGVAGAALIYTALRTRARLEERSGTKRLPPLVAARLAALALAASRVGAVVGGGYAGYAGFLLPELTTAYRREVAFHCLLCVLGAVTVIIGAILLERALRLPEDIDEVSATG